RDDRRHDLTKLALDEPHREGHQMSEARYAHKVALLTLAISCSPPDHGKPSTLDGAWIQPEVRFERTLPRTPQFAAAQEQWRTRPDREAATLLARAAYPEFLTSERPDSARVLNPETALLVTFPRFADGAMEISTRHYSFWVTRV